MTSCEQSGLTVEGLTVKRGDLTICHEVSLSVPAGEITVLLGANGAGKTTLLDGIAGAIPTVSGAIRLAGESKRIDRLPMHRRAMSGIGYVTQNRAVFNRLTVAQNIAVVDSSKVALARSFSLFPRLAERHFVRAGLLSGGEQQMLLIARALVANPRILLIDELSLGLSPAVVTSLMAVLTGLVRDGMGILLVEQFAESALSIGTTAHILRRGRIVRTESCDTLLKEATSTLPYGLGSE